MTANLPNQQPAQQPAAPAAPVAQPAQQQPAPAAPVAQPAQQPAVPVAQSAQQQPAPNKPPEQKEIKKTDGNKDKPKPKQKKSRDKKDQKTDSDKGYKGYKGKKEGEKPGKPGDEIDPALAEELANTDVGDLLSDIVLTALEQKASDVHIEPIEKEVIVRYRIDGLLIENRRIHKQLQESLIFKIKILSKLRTDEHFAPQDGRIRFDVDDEGKYLDTRVSILPTTNGEKTVLRLLTQDGRSFALDDLGIVGRDFDLVKKAYSKPFGTILTVGPTGSGKTTTLYGILKILNSPQHNLTTVENPVEYNIDGVNHVQINTKAGLTFAAGLRAILRQDPDIVMVGEIRDGETARIATNAAMTGHLVLSTLHTNDSVGSIPRLVDMGIEPFLIASTVNLVIAQRLARKVCVHCRQLYVMTPEQHAQIASLRPDIASLIRPGERFYKESSCDICKNGFTGRLGLYEVFQITENIRKVMTTTTNADEIFKVARAEGLVLILEDGIKKLRAGIITISELFRVTALRA